MSSRHSCLGLGLSLLLLTLGARAPLAGQDPAQVIRELEPIVDSLLATYGSADADGVVSFYAKDAAVLTAEGLLVEESISQALHFHFRLLSTQTFDFEERGTRALSDSTAVTWMIGRTQGIDQGGAVIFEGRVVVSVHWLRENGRWKIAFAHEEFAR